jgi:alpha(1,3/1,4) fucosyltransferase
MSVKNPTNSTDRRSESVAGSKLHIAMILPRIDQRDYFVHLFRMRYNIVADAKNPKIVLYDDYSSHLVPPFRTKPVRIVFTGESRDIDYSNCDFSLSFDQDHPKSIYLPLWVLFIDWFKTGDMYYCGLSEIIGRPKVTTIDKTHFCGFVASNSVLFRNAFVTKLSQQYKQVTCAGAALNNHPRIAGSMGRAKIIFQQRCKFVIAFENRSRKGYITEKLLHAFQSRAIPIYWGCKTVSQYFNPRAFINCHAYGSLDEVLAEIKRLDNDDDAYLEMLNQPVFIGDVPPANLTPEAVLNSIVERAKI